MEEPSHNAAPRLLGRLRPRWQFTLRALLLLTAVIALVLGWAHRVRRQAQNVQELLSINPNAGVYYSHQFDSEGALDTKAEPLMPEWLRRWTGAEQTSSVTVVALQYATDAELEQVAKLPALERLILVRAVDVTDRGLERISTLRRLRVLKLYDADMLTDAGIKHLARLTNLEQLTFGPRPKHVTAKALDDLRRALPNCRIIVTDEEGDERQLRLSSR